MKNIFLRVATLGLFTISSLVVVALIFFVAEDLFQFSMSNERLLIKIGVFDLTHLLFGVLVMQSVGILMMMVEMTMEVEERERGINILD